MTALGEETVVVRNAPFAYDARYGNAVRDWNAAVDTIVTGAAVQPLDSVENDVDREHTVTRLRLLAPPGAAVIAADSRVVWHDTTYEVDGQPDFWFDNGALDHIEATLKRLAG